jgi:hypothetical protein
VAGGVEEKTGRQKLAMAPEEFLIQAGTAKNPSTDEKWALKKETPLDRSILEN